MTRRQLSQARVRLNRIARQRGIHNGSFARDGLNVGDIVRWRPPHDGVRHVLLVSLGYKWARIRLYGPGVLQDDGTRVPREKKVRVEELEESLW